MNKPLRKWTVGLFLMLMLLQSNQIMAVYFHFLLHCAEVIALYCAPRHGEESDCHGQCFLSEQINREYDAGEPSFLNDIRLIQIAFPGGSPWRPQLPEASAAAQIITSASTYYFLHLFSIFHPPKLR